LWPGKSLVEKINSGFFDELTKTIISGCSTALVDGQLEGACSMTAVKAWRDLTFALIRAGRDEQ
jgi:hypothetical protein